MITTGAMIRLGKTYGNLMVDLRATNNKLIDRSQRIVMEVTGVSRPDAKILLDRADKSVKTAIVMHKKGVTREEAERLDPERRRDQTHHKGPATANSRELECLPESSSA